MRILLTSLSTISLAVAAVEDLSPSQVAAKAALEETVKINTYRGSVFAQAELDGIDYRPILRRAIDHDAEALASLFVMRFMGEAAETHGQNLLQLMRLWDDEKFSELLAQQPEKVRDLVVASINHAWADPDWERYSKTLASSPNSKTK